MSDSKTINLESLLWTAVKTSLRAGEAILEVYGSSDFGASLKEDQSPLTRADRQSHEIILKNLPDASRPFPVLSEEGRDIPFAERREWEYFWMVDPLDGTKEFLKKNGEFTVNIALIHGNQAVLGVVYAPALNNLYFGAIGLGSYKTENLDRIRLEVGSFLSFSKKLSAGTQPPQTGPLRVVASRSHISPETKEYVQSLGQVELISAGSSLKFCLVAEGKADVYPRFASTMEWDTAAGQVIVEQAGGLVRQSTAGESLRYNKENLRNPWFIAERMGMMTDSPAKAIH